MRSSLSSTIITLECTMVWVTRSPSRTSGQTSRTRPATPACASRRPVGASSRLPVDLAQASIGPGMAIFTRYSRVLDAEGKPLSVRQALALINQTLGEVLALALEPAASHALS